MRPHARTAAAGLLSLVMIGATATGLTGCSSGPTEPQVIRGDRLPDSGLTPVERGRIRESVLKAARTGYDAWLANDVAAMRQVWAGTYVEYYEKLYAKYRAEGRVRVRKMEIKNFDMVELNRTGDEAIVQVYVNDRSYYANAAGKRTSEPTGRDTYLQLTLEKQTDGGWRIVRAIMSNDLMN
jgi:ketosteroid isomerase-like protein